MILDQVEVASVERLSPSFARFELAGPALADLGCEQPSWDQRIKLVFPGSTGRLPDLDGADESWWDRWLEQPEAERGHMRTYTVRTVRGSGAERRLVVDIVLHPEGDGVDLGPGCAWAARAAAGDRLVAIAPRRGHDFGGIEFAPGAARELLLVADETAVPAVCSILEGLDRDARGLAVLEVPHAADAEALAAAQTAPAGVRVVWRPRDGAALGSLLEQEVRRHLGLGGGHVEVDDSEVDPDLWETPAYSSSGEPVAAPGEVEGLYAWIAGESKVVTGLRRVLVNEAGLDRRQVAFMGYWRRGVSMRG
ncbi:siderophore-interacting protein [Nocardioides anomalus]|uniref:Siderophore-interacting protein n=2 Tax=Nocardioides anomalus TaxID=2712223 RepID=A0A6G6WM50_9ACTN|nr:siderophore-interacting protein [Nocardioides anomalus]